VKVRAEGKSLLPESREEFWAGKASRALIAGCHFADGSGPLG